LLSTLGILTDTRLELNSLGDIESRKIYHKILVEYFNDHKGSLSQDSLVRLAKNPLRILDSKDENDRKLIAKAPICYDYYNDFSRDFFNQIKEILDDFGIIYNINPRLVRGLDYYTHTVFEFVTDKLGAQGTVIAGGRYDGLVKLMGGADTPAIGFASGIERLCGLINYKPIVARPVMVIAVGADMVSHAAKIARLLRESGIIVEINYKHDVGKQMKKASDINASCAIFIGSEELSNGKVKIKNLDKREEHLVDLERLIDYLQQYV
jgi:histidyl-tRNA synthetase